MPTEILYFAPCIHFYEVNFLSLKWKSFSFSLLLLKPKKKGRDAPQDLRPRPVVVATWARFFLSSSPPPSFACFARSTYCYVLRRWENREVVTGLSVVWLENVADQVSCSSPWPIERVCIKRLCTLLPRLPHMPRLCDRCLWICLPMHFAFIP